MVDFGVLSAIRDTLQSHCEFLGEAIAEKIYISAPLQSSTLPMVVLELEEIWTSLALGQHAPSAKLKLKAKTLSDTTTSKESLTISEKIRSLIDGKTLTLSDGKSVTLRFENSIVDIPTNVNKTRNVQQYFEAIVRG